MNNSISKEINFYDISSDTSDYKDSSSDEEEETDDDLDEMSDTEKQDNKYLSIFDNNCVDFDEKIMTLENVAELKKWRLQW